MSIMLSIMCFNGGQCPLCDTLVCLIASRPPSVVQGKLDLSEVCGRMLDITEGERDDINRS